MTDVGRIIARPDSLNVVAARTSRALAFRIRRSSNVARVVLCLALNVAAPGTFSGAPGPESASEYDLKAAMLYNLIHFVEWPQSAYGNAQDATVICILGRDPFGRALSAIAAKRTANGRPLDVRHVQNPSAARSCHLLYVSSSERKNVSGILSALNGASVLTVAEMAQFAVRGGVVQFELQNKQVHFDINLDASRRADLKVSSRLLVLANIIKDNQRENADMGMRAQ